MSAANDDPLAGLGLRVRVLGREVEGGWKCEDCGVLLVDDVSLYAHREVAHPLSVEREHAEQNGTMDRGDLDGGVPS